MYFLKNYLKLMRIHHWIKNIFIFIPLVFSRNLFKINFILFSLGIFLLFSLGSSIIYVINDLCDIEKDKNHPRKCNRPLASGKISIREAKFLIFFLIIVFVFLSLTVPISAALIVVIYIILNLFYSLKLKNYPIVDVLIIAAGFIFRVVAGGLAIKVEISKWLMLTIFSLALFLGFGKRRNELISDNSHKKREVLLYYNIDSLNNFINIFATMFLVFYSLYSFEEIVSYFYITIPLVIYGLLKYNLLLQKKDIEGDPTEILLHDKGIRVVCVLYIIILIVLIYIIM